MSPGDGLTSYFTGAEDYYLSSPGQWQGKGATTLGLAGTVTREDFGQVANGYSPATGERLVAGKEVADSDTGRGYRKQAGNDLTFSADKSISIAAVADPKIKELHENAVAKVVDYIEANNVQARQQVNGYREISQTSKLVAAKFTHMTSRELDPQLHTHVFVHNMTQREDGQWRALINRSIFQDKMALGKLYRNELAHELKNAGYGLEVTDRQQGFFRIKGVSKQLEEHFSKRRAEIEARVKDHDFKEMIAEKYPNADRSTIYQIATLGTRSAKKKVSGQEIQENWCREIERKGHSIEGIKHSIDKAKQQQREINKKSRLVPKTTIDQAVQAVTETESVFTKSQILKAAADLNFGEYSLGDLDRTFRSSKNLKRIGREHGREFYTSKEMLKIEQSIIKTARDGKGKRNPLANPEEVKVAIDSAEKKNGWSYTQGQKQAIQALATARDRVIIIQGDAGTGKTASMDVFRTLTEAKGYMVRGLGFTGKSADTLEKGAGIRSQTIDSFLIQHQAGHAPSTNQVVEQPAGSSKILTKKNLTMETGTDGSRSYTLTNREGHSISTPHNRKNINTPGKEVWLVDESSMTGSRHLWAILKKAEKDRATVVLLGDTKQFDSIAAGRMFKDLQEKIGVHVRMTEVLRQKTPETRSVVSALNRGKTDKAFDILESQGRLKEYKSTNDLRRAAVQHYNIAAKDGKDVVVIAASNNDRRQLNRDIKSVLIRSGIVKQGKNHTVLTPHNVSPVQAGLASSYEQGQTVQVTKSFDGLKGGQSGQVTGIDHDKNTVTIHAGKKDHSIDIGKHHSDLTFYRNETINLSRGDKVVFLKNDKNLGVKNGQIGTIKQLDARGNAIAKTGNKTVRFSLAAEGIKQPGDARYTYKHIDHGMVLTAYKSQGATVDNVVWFAPTKAGKNRQIDRQTAYVATTRAKHSFTILTDGKNELKNAVSKSKDKRSIFGEKGKLETLKSMAKERQQEKSKSNVPVPKIAEMTMGH